MAKQFVCVRVIDMTDVDLSVFDFSYDLTFAALLMHPDGRIYHTFAGRDAKSATSHTSLPALMSAMRSTLAQHKDPKNAPKQSIRPRRTPRQLREQAGRNGKNCIHCHQVFEFEYEILHKRRRFKREHLWRWPTPARLGLTLHTDNQVRITKAAGLAKKAGLKAEDRLVKVGPLAVLTYGDVQRALHELPTKIKKLEVVYSRGGQERTAMFALPRDWREEPVAEFAWRGSMWPLSPKPGFGGPPLNAGQKKQLGLSADSWAFRVKYIVTWGSNSHTGRNAARAGIRKGDIVYEVDGKSDFFSMQYFHTWFRFTRKIGKKAEVKIIRKGQRLTIRLPLID